MLCGAAFAEPDGDPAFENLNTVAAKDGDKWVINGEKSFVLNGSMAGFYCVLCRTQDDGEGKSAASVFLVEGNTPGMSVVDSGEKLGLRMTKTCGLKFENVSVPQDQLIGKEDNGLKQAQTTMDEGRLFIASLALGTAQGAFDRALDYTKQREQFGKKIIRFQVTQHKLAEMATKIEQVRFFVYGAAQAVVRGKVDTRLASMAKMVATRTAVEVASEAIQLLGGYGYMTEYEIERFYRDAKSMELLGGSPGYLKDLIAKSVIGRVK
jgi:alkylation response protein AidB-like acyl-CoA dehydrogenase